MLFRSICDECSKVKNPKTKIWKTIKYLNANRKWGLSGTLIINSPLDLYGVIECLSNGFFGMNWWQFRERFCILQKRFRRGGYGGWIEISGYKNLDVLRDDIMGIFLRRRKSDDEIKEELVGGVSKGMVINNYRSQLSGIERKVYDKIKDKVLEKMKKGDESLKLGEVVLLKEVVNDVRLIINSNSPLAWEICSELKLDELYKQECHNSKINILLKILEEVKNDKVIVFTQFKKMAYIIQEELKNKGIKCVLFSGGLNSQEREKIKIGRASCRERV